MDPATLVMIAAAVLTGLGIKRSYRKPPPAPVAETAIPPPPYSFYLGMGLRPAVTEQRGERERSTKTQQQASADEGAGEFPSPAYGALLMSARPDVVGATPAFTGTVGRNTPTPQPLTGARFGYTGRAGAARYGGYSGGTITPYKGP